MEIRTKEGTPQEFTSNQTNTKCVVSYRCRFLVFPSPPEACEKKGEKPCVQHFNQKEIMANQEYSVH